MTALTQIKAIGAKERDFVAHDIQMSQTEADAASALKNSWKFSSVQFIYMHSFWYREMHPGPKPALKSLKNIFRPFHRDPLHLETEMYIV